MPIVTLGAQGEIKDTDITALPASIITSGQLALARGGTNADLSASGSATAVLAQAADHSVSARALVFADIPSSSNPGAAAAILATTSGGLLTLLNLVVSGVINLGSAFPAGIISEVGSKIIEFGVNEGSTNRFGTYDSSFQGGMFRFDARAGQNLLQFYGRAAGVSNLSGSLCMSLDSSGVLNLSSIPAFVASDRYLVVDASGNIHKSALGPAS
jgi:hypothetical protein